MAIVHLPLVQLSHIISSPNWVLAGPKIAYTNRIEDSHLKNVRFTTPIQQLHINPSHEDGSHTLGPTFIWGVVVQLLWWCSVRIKSHDGEDKQIRIQLIHVGWKPSLSRIYNRKFHFIRSKSFSIYILKAIKPPCPLSDFRAWNTSRVIIELSYIFLARTKAD
jgi:hypothetical protein